MFAMVTEMPLLVEQAGRLVREAALLLGMDVTAARLAASTATLAAGDKTVTVLLIGQTDDNGLSLVISVQTRVPVPSGDGAGGVLSVLHQVPGALHAFVGSPGRFGGRLLDRAPHDSYRARRRTGAGRAVGGNRAARRTTSCWTQPTLRTDLRGPP